MSNSDKINRWLEFAKSNGWKRVSYPAPHEWLVNKLTGKECAPSFFWPTWLIGILLGAFWSAFWGTFMYYTVWQNKTFSQIAIPSIVCGLCFGLASAAFHWQRKRKYGLTTWKKFIDSTDSLNRAYNH